jgi:hypothetical protein
MQPVTRFPFEVTAVHAVIGFEMPDDGLDGLSPLEQLSLLRELKSNLVYGRSLA